MKKKIIIKIETDEDDLRIKSYIEKSCIADWIKENFQNIPEITIEVENA